MRQKSNPICGALTFAAVALALQTGACGPSDAAPLTGTYSGELKGGGEKGCGNGVCAGKETCKNCIADCGPCPAVCGDGNCDLGESCASCTADCGTCEPVCGDGTCDAGENCYSCVADCGNCPSCLTPYTNCAGSCVNLQSDRYHCGACDHPCPLGVPWKYYYPCVEGTCIECRLGIRDEWVDCDGLAATGCEVNLYADVNNCGGCGKACSPAPGPYVCIVGRCTLCGVGVANCNGTSADGCETHLLTDSSNCGACGIVCPEGAGCSDGTCL